MARSLGFQPSASHGRRTRRLWGNIGLLWGRFAPFTSGVYEGVLDTIGERLVERGWRLLYTPVPEADAWRSLQMAQRLDGVLAVSHVPESVLADLATERYPAVLLNLQSPLPLPQFMPDDHGGMRLIAEHLASLGHRHVVYLAHHDGGVGHFSERDRPAGLAAAGKELGLRISTFDQRNYARVLAACQADATAVICYDWNDIPGVCAAFAHAGLVMPRDVSLACCTDVRWFAYLTPAITALEVPIRELAVQAVQALIKRIDGEVTTDEKTVPVILPATLRIRASTGPARR